LTVENAVKKLFSHTKPGLAIPFIAGRSEAEGVETCGGENRMELLFDLKLAVEGHKKLLSAAI
jgi:hypothetical protein